MFNFNARYARLLFISIACISTWIHGERERITLFESDITINQNASLTVRETIHVVSTGATIKRGIVREFPTKYRDHKGYNYTVGFDVLKVLHNGAPATYHIEEATNGKKIYIGNPALHIAHGPHTYTIIYKTDRQLGFFENYDELYFNITGNGWRLPIDRAQATIHLPEVTEKITAEGYTGSMGWAGDSYHAKIDASTVYVNTTKPLDAYEGLTVAITWPKGYVTEPSWFQKLCWFLKDNIFYLILIINILIVSLWYFWQRRIMRRANKPGVVIPRFYPPNDMAPSAIGFITARSFDNKLLAPDIVDLAVHGLVTIEHERTGFFWKNSHLYTLKKTDNTPVTAHHTQMLKKLFAKHDNLVINEKNQPVVMKTVEWLEKSCATLKKYLFEPNITAALVVSASIVILTLLSVFIDAASDASFWLLVAPLVPLWLYTVGSNAYTPAGRSLQDEIDGFKLFLATAETERMKIIGTPPTKTPELYEKYLPYAMALGVEEQWTAQFTPIFAQLAVAGHTYHPTWYIGKRFDADSFNSGAFASSLTSSLSSSISSATTPPGSSSGSGGRGRSGGGGGGGGGGGW